MKTTTIVALGWLALPLVPATHTPAATAKTRPTPPTPSATRSIPG